MKKSMFPYRYMFLGTRHEKVCSHTGVCFWALGMKKSTFPYRYIHFEFITYGLNI
jgi:hypothetical protein